MINGCYLLPGAEFYVAVDDCGLWPNLTLLPNGEIAATAYDQPSHGFGCGNIGLWVSRDGGRLWELRSTVSDHCGAPEQVRMEQAAGLNGEGEIVVLVSGWSKGRTHPILPIQVCISRDCGHSWQRHCLDTNEVPWGNILCLPDGTLCSAVHNKPDHEEYAGWVFFSRDGGNTWGDKRLIMRDADETDIVRLRSGRMLAAARQSRGAGDPGGLFGTRGLALHVSDDNGVSWRPRGPVSLPCQVPGSFLELQNGAVLLAYGSRFSGLYGVVLRLSRDGGDTWSLPCPLITIPHRTDCGYPSSVQLKDGRIVTAYYFGPKRGGSYPHPNALPWHPRYHMGVARWKLEDFERELATNED